MTVISLKFISAVWQTTEYIDASFFGSNPLEIEEFVGVCWMIALERKDSFGKPGKVGKKGDSVRKMQVTRIPDCTDTVWKTKGEAKNLQEIIRRLQSKPQTEHNSAFPTP